MTNTIKLQIRKPNDSGNFWEVNIKSDLIRNGGNHAVYSDRRAKDPIHSAITVWFRDNLKRKCTRYRDFRLPTGDFTKVMHIGSCAIAIGRKGNRLTLNGQVESLSTISTALARVAYKAVFEKNAGKLLQTLFKTLSMPEDVKYCLENRVPFHFYDNFTKTSVRLKAQQINDNEIAIEVSDGIWGTMSLKELESYCAFYLHGKKRSKKWMFVSPDLLYERTVGSKPKVSDMKLMVEFLKQNRQQDIVEARARRLVREMVAQYPDRLSVEYDNEIPAEMIVNGKGWDWKLTNSSYKSDIQKVSTYVWQPKLTKSSLENQILAWEEEVKKSETLNAQNKLLFDTANLDPKEVFEPQKLPPKPNDKPTWKGPICIDNMSTGSSLGDQFVTRALALLNDTMTVKIVNTIQRYLITDEDTCRYGDMNEMP